MCVGPAFFVVLCSIPKRNFDWETPLGFKRVCLAKVENDDFGPKSAWEILVCVCVCVPGFFRGAVFNSQTILRLGDTTRNQKNTSGKGGGRRFRAEIRLIDSGACVCARGPGFFRGTVFNSQTKLRLGDTTRIQKSMFGKGAERRFRAEIRLGDSGVCACVCPAFFVVLSSLVASQFPNETSIGRHH